MGTDIWISYKFHYKILLFFGFKKIYKNKEVIFSSWKIGSRLDLALWLSFADFCSRGITTVTCSSAIYSPLPITIFPLYDCFYFYFKIKVCVLCHFLEVQTSSREGLGKTSINGVFPFSDKAEEVGWICRRVVLKPALELGSLDFLDQDSGWIVTQSIANNVWLISFFVENLSRFFSDLQFITTWHTPCYEPVGLLSVLMLLLSLVGQPENGERGKTMFIQVKLHRCHFRLK